MDGVKYLWRGFGLIRKSGLRRFVIIPLLINFVLFSSLTFLGFYWFDLFTHWAISQLPSWLSWLSSLLWVVFGIATLLIFAYTFTTVANLLAAPFNSLLAEKVVKHLNPTAKAAQNFSLLQEMPRSLAREGQKLVYYLPRAIILLLLLLIPALNVVISLLWLVFSAWMMAVEYLDYPMDNNQVPFKTMRKQLRGNWWDTLPFGGLILFFSLVPVINLFIMPAAVAGAAAFWVGKFDNSSYQD